MDRFVSNLRSTLHTYKRYFGISILFALPLLGAIVLTLMAPIPTFHSLGGVYLRTLDISEIGWIEAFGSAATYAVSALIFAIVFVNISLIVKKRKTRRKIKITKEKTWEYSYEYFFVLFLLGVMLAIVQAWLYAYGNQAWYYPIFELIVSTVALYTGPAIVIEEKKGVSAVKYAIRFIRRMWREIAYFFISTTAVLSILDWVAISVVPGEFGRYAMLVINSLILVPFIIIFVSHQYMDKYPLAR